MMPYESPVMWAFAAFFLGSGYAYHAAIGARIGDPFGLYVLGAGLAYTVLLLGMFAWDVFTALRGEGA